MKLIKFFLLVLLLPCLFQGVYAELVLQKDGKSIHIYTNKDLKSRTSTPLIDDKAKYSQQILLQSKLPRFSLKRKASKIKAQPNQPQAVTLPQANNTSGGFSVNFEKIVEGYQSPQALAEYYWMPEDKIPIHQASHVNQMKVNQFYNHHKSTFFDMTKKFRLKIKPENYPSWRTCGLLFFDGSGPVIAAKQLLCDICLNIAEKKGPMEEMINFIAGIPYWKYKGSADSKQVNDDWLRHKTTKEEIKFPYGYLAHDITNYKGFLKDQVYDRDYKTKPEFLGDWNSYLQQENIFPLPIPLFRIENIVEDLHNFRHAKCFDKTKDCPVFTVKECTAFANGERDKSTLTEEERSKLLTVEKEFKKEKMKAIYWHISTPVAQSYENVEYMKSEALASSVGSWFCAGPDGEPYAPDLPKKKETDEKLIGQEFETHMKKAFLNSKGCRRSNQFCPFKSFEIDESKEQKNYKDEIGSELERKMAAIETLKEFIFKPIAGLKDFETRITLNSKKFGEHDYIYFEVIENKKEACSNSEAILGKNPDMYKNQYAAGKENNKVEKLGPKGENGFTIDYIFRKEGKYRLCHQPAVLIEEKVGDKVKIVEDVSKRTGKFVPVGIDQNILKQSASPYKADFEIFQVVEGGVCKINDNWLQKNQEMVCLKCEGVFCKEMNPSKSIARQDLENPFYKNFIPFIYRSSSLKEDETSNNDCKGANNFNNKCSNGQGICRIRPTFIIEDNTAIEEKFRYSLVRGKGDNLYSSYSGKNACVLDQDISNEIDLAHLQNLSLLNIGSDRKSFSDIVQKMLAEKKDPKFRVALTSNTILGPCRANFDPRTEESKLCDFPIPVDQPWGLGYQLLGFKKGQKPNMKCVSITNSQVQDSKKLLANAWKQYSDKGFPVSPSLIARQLSIFPVNNILNEPLHTLFTDAGINIKIDIKADIIYHQSSSSSQNKISIEQTLKKQQI